MTSLRVIKTKIRNFLRVPFARLIHIWMLLFSVMCGGNLHSNCLVLGMSLGVSTRIDVTRMYPQYKAEFNYIKVDEIDIKDKVHISGITNPIIFVFNKSGILIQVFYGITDDRFNRMAHKIFRDFENYEKKQKKSSINIRASKHNCVVDLRYASFGGGHYASYEGYEVEISALTKK